MVTVHTLWVKQKESRPKWLSGLRKQTVLIQSQFEIELNIYDQDTGFQINSVLQN